MGATVTEPSEEGNELEVLDPDQELQIQGETVVVRELRYAEGVRLMPRLQPVLEVFGELVEGGDDAGDELSFYDRLMAEHPDVMFDVFAQACDRDRAWIDSLSDDDGSRVEAAFWRANRGFFVRRLWARSPRARALAARLAVARAGHTPASGS